MRKKLKTVLISLVVVILFSLTSLQSFCQVEFPDSNAVWRVAWRGDCFSQIPKVVYDYSITGDTVIDSYSYRKLHRESFCLDCCAPPDSIYNGYVGSFRKNSSGLKVFYIPVGDTSEVLLYDFTLNVGDTVSEFLANGGDGWCNDNTQYISEIDSILLNDNNYYKRFVIEDSSGCQDKYIIEGIGSLSDLIEPFFKGGYQGGDLICYSFNGFELYYADSDAGCTYNAIDEINSSSLLNIFPNPAGKEVFINLQHGNNPVKISCFDICGNKQKINYEFSENLLRMDVSEYSSGVYFLRIENPMNEEIIVEKLIITPT